MNRLVCQSLHKSFGPQEVLRGVSFTVNKGETLAVLGRSGSGKSTLLKCINLLLHSGEGELALDGQVYCQGGRPLYAPWEVRKKVGLVFQDFHLFPHFSVRKNIELALTQVIGLDQTEACDRAERVSSHLEIKGLLERYPMELSGGQAQRVAIARALVLHPQVLLLDEITSALDPESVASVVKSIEEIRALGGNEDLSLVLVTHLVRFAENFANRIAFLENGVLVDQHPAGEFRTRVKSSEAQRFLEEFSGWG